MIYGSNNGVNGSEADNNATISNEDVFAAKGVRNNAP